MTIRSEQQNGNSLIIYISGRLDTISASTLELEMKRLVDGTKDVILDLKDLSYISSSGLHVMLQTQKLMNVKNKKLIIKNMGEAVRDIFNMTGFNSIIKTE